MEPIFTIIWAFGWKFRTASDISLFLNSLFVVRMILDDSCTLRDSKTGFLSRWPKYALYPSFLARRTCFKLSEIITKDISSSVNSFATSLPNVANPTIMAWFLACIGVILSDS